jgi:hypothetical protein
MPASKIMIIRHAEKPSTDNTVAGVSAAGASDPEELVVRGWQRSGALVRFFAPCNGPLVDLRLAHDSRARHPPQMSSHSESCKGEETARADAAIAADGPVLIAWEHEGIPSIAIRILGNSTSCPQHWPGPGFDLVWVFNRTTPTGRWTFDQVPQMLLSGDSTAPIPMDAKPDE